MTFTANQRLTIVLSFLAALFVTFVVAYNIGKDDTVLADHTIYTCAVENVGDSSGHTDDTAALLRSAGWYGIGGDGGEILYSPACASQYDVKIPVPTR